MSELYAVSFQHETFHQIRSLQQSSDVCDCIWDISSRHNASVSRAYSLSTNMLWFYRVLERFSLVSLCWLWTCVTQLSVRETSFNVPPSVGVLKSSSLQLLISRHLLDPNSSRIHSGLNFSNWVRKLFWRTFVSALKEFSLAAAGGGRTSLAATSTLEAVTWKLCWTRFSERRRRQKLHV